MTKQVDKPQMIKGQCPSCAYRGHFRYIGTQIWPSELAERMGVPREIELYQCENCLTSISEPLLLPFD